MKIGITSKFDCLLEIDGVRYEMTSDFSRIEVLLEQHETLSGLVYPINARGLLSYAFSLNDFTKNQSTMEICKIKEDEVELTLKPYYLTGQNFFRKKFKFENTNFALSIGYFNTLSCEDKEGEIFLDFYDKLNSFKFDVLNGVVYFHSKTLSNYEILIVYDKQNHRFLKYESECFKFEDNQIEFLTSEETISKHGKHFVINCNNGKLDIAQELVYLKGEPQKVKNNSLLPFAFFEAVKVKDYELAKSYLSKNLKSKITNEILQEYFGEYDKIMPYNFHKEKGNYICLKQNNFAKVFRLKIIDGEIDEIENCWNFHALTTKGACVILSSEFSNVQK